MAPTMSELTTFMIYCSSAGAPTDSAQIIRLPSGSNRSTAAPTELNRPEQNQTGFSQKFVILPVEKAVKALMVIANKLCP